MVFRSVICVCHSPPCGLTVTDVVLYYSDMT